MNKKFLLCVVLSAVIMITSCTSDDQYPWEIGKESPIDTFSEDVTLSIGEGGLTSSGGTVVIENNGETEIYYDIGYEVQLRKGRKWYEIDVECAFHAIGFPLLPGEKVDLDIDWRVYYDNLPAGKYRQVRSYFDITGNKHGNETGDMHYIAVEFEIE